MEPDRIASAGWAPAGVERPRAVTVIAVAWLIFGALRFSGGLVGLIMWKLGGMQELMTGPTAFSGIRTMRILRFAFRNFGLEAISQMLVGLVVVFCAVALLRLRPWGRPAVETLCWLGLVFVICFSLAWVFLWTRIVGETATEPPSVRPLGTAIALAIMGGLAFVFVAMIRALRRPDVRAVFRKA